MQLKIKAAICILITVLYSAILMANEKKLSGLVYDGPNMSYWIEPPKGWNITNDVGKQLGITAVYFIPQGNNFDDAPAIMYAQAFHKDEHFQNLENFIKNDLNDFKQQTKHFILKKSGTCKTKDNTLGKMIEIEADSPNEYEAIAYIEQKQGIAMLVLSARNAKDYEAAKPAFKELISSCVDAGIHVKHH